MWKGVLLVIGLFVAYLLIPNYDLLRRESMLSDNYELVHEGYWRVDDCKLAGREFDAGYRCVRRTPWQDLMGRRSAYVKERDTQ